MTTPQATVTEPKDFGWVLLELMGHRQRVGLAREEQIAGSLLLRIDIPTEGDDYVTEYYGSSSIYSMRPISEEVAQEHWARTDPRPTRPTEYRSAPQIENATDAEEEDNPF